MSFTDQDKRILIEVVNHIQNAYISDQAFQESENSITLPARLVRLSAEAIGKTYRPGILTSLDNSDLELLLHSLVKAVAAMKISLQDVVAALPQRLPDELDNKLNAQIQEFESMRTESQSFTSAPKLLEPGTELRLEKQADDLLQRRDSLVAAQNGLSEVSLEELREEVFRLEAEVEPKRRKMEELQRSVSEKTVELERLTNAIADAQQILKANDTSERQQLDNIVGIAADMVTAVDPFLTKCESQIREAVEKVAETVSEGRRLKAELQGRIVAVSELFAETAHIAKVLKLYADADRRVARSMPTVISVTKEKLNRVEQQLREIDADLKDALSQHQSAKHLAEVARV